MIRGDVWAKPKSWIYAVFCAVIWVPIYKASILYSNFNTFLALSGVKILAGTALKAPALLGGEEEESSYPRSFKSRIQGLNVS